MFLSNWLCGQICPGNLRVCGGIGNDCSVVEVNDDESCRCKRRGNGPGQSPAKPPWFADGGGQRYRGLIQLRQGERNQCAALGAHGEMVEQLLAFVRGQRLLHKRADLIRVWMVSELKRLAHVGPITADAAV